MGTDSAIQWTDHTFNPWWGCSRVSPGCEHCYAETFSKRVGLKVWGASAERRFFGEKHHAEPFKWNEKAKKAGVRYRVFCASMCDVFEQGEGATGVRLTEERARLWTTIENTPHLDWQLLTKRPQNMRNLVPASWAKGWPANVWAGCTTENQDYVAIRIPSLLDVPAHIHFISYEPALGPIELDAYLSKLSWVIVGGESGAGARDFSLGWASNVVTACREANVPVFVKQLGARAFEDCDGEGGIGERLRLKDSHGGDWDEWPWRTLKVREFPPFSTTTSQPKVKP